MTAEEIRDILSESFPFKAPRKEQDLAFDALAPWLQRLYVQGFQPLFFGIDAPTGCHAKGTKIIKHDGTIELVENIKEGDALMGPDSRPRIVQRLYRGRETMYRVVPVKGEPFVVNKSHVLSLQRTVRDSNHRLEKSPQGRKRRIDFRGLNHIENISVEEYLKKSKTFKHCHKLYKTGVEFEKTHNLPIPPYILGAWLGDGSSDSTALTNQDEEVLSAWISYGKKVGLTTRIKTKAGCKTVYLRGLTRGKNKLLSKFKELKLIKNKHIPQAYLTATRQERLELLAGLMDTDGSLSHSCFDYISVSNRLAEEVLYLARSLGFGAALRPCRKTCQTGVAGDYYRVTIYGDTDLIPVKINYKKAKKRKQVKRALLTGFKLEELPADDYYGFELDGDHLYLMGDFTVTHNSGKSPLAITVARTVLKVLKRAQEESPGAGDEEYQKKPRVWIVTLNKLLQDQYRRDFDQYVFDFRGQDNYRCYYEDKSCAQATCGRISAPKGKEPVPPKYCSKACEYDEVKDEALRAPILLLNVAKALNMIKMGIVPDFMIFDEGHGVESALDNESSVSLDPTTMSRLQLRFEDFFTNLSDMGKIKVGLEKLESKCRIICTDEENNSPATRNIKRFREAERLVNKCGQILADMAEGIEYVSCSRDKIDLRPLQINKIFQRTFEFPVLFLSATLLSKKGFSSMTGIKEAELGWFACESPFPVENRHIYQFWRMGAQGLNFNNESVEMPNLLLRISEVLNKHPNERGIIHTHTYRYATEIYQRLYAKYGSRLLFPKNAPEQKEMLEKHARSKNTVLISPSMTEGVDLKDELCRFVVLCKVPYLPMNDPVVMARKDANPEWYAYRSAMTIVQAPGRGVRSETDHAATYLVDPGFMRFMNMNSHHFPGWFTKSLIKGYKGSH